MEVGRREKVVEWVIPAVIKLAQVEGFTGREQVREFLLGLESSRDIRTHNTAEGRK